MLRKPCVVCIEIAMNRSLCLSHLYLKSGCFELRPRSIYTGSNLSAIAKSFGHDETIDDAETASAKKEWMKVRYRGHHKAERKVWFYAHDETYRTNADEARLISDKKMMALKQSLVTKGFAREIKPYEPPKDVEDRVSRCFVDASSKRGSENMLDYPLTDHLLKFKFLNLCRSRFDHEVPNCDLYRMKTVKDVVVFYATPVRGVNSYDALIRVQDELPANLHILPEAAKFNPNDVTAFHKGVDAYPGLIDRIRGIRNQKNNPSQRTEFKWPDI